MRFALASTILALATVGSFAESVRGSNNGRGEENSNAKSAVKSFPPKIDFRLDPWLPQEDPQDTAQRLAMPSLTQPFYNMVLDVRATTSAADLELIFSTNGNWMAGLMKLLDEKYFPENPSVKDSYLVTTSPPISLAQMSTGLLKVGNILYKDAQPHVVAGPGKFLDNFENAGFGDGDRIPIIQTYGNIILKRKGDKNIQSFADLAKLEPGRFASSDPAEGGSYNNYRGTIYNLVVNHPDLLGISADKAEEAAADLQAHLFDTAGVATLGAPMHRSVPHMVATGQADAGLFFLHLAVVAMQENPGVFEAIYLANDKVGSTDDPNVLLQGQDPLEGNRAPVFSVLRTNTPVNAAQDAAREAFIADLQSPEFTDILTAVGLRRP